MILLRTIEKIVAFSRLFFIINGVTFEDSNRRKDLLEKNS
jgi:hypothetical protein